MLFPKAFPSNPELEAISEPLGINVFLYNTVVLVVNSDGGGGGRFLQFGIVSGFASERRLTWKMTWILQCAGSSSW